MSSVDHNRAPLALAHAHLDDTVG